MKVWALAALLLAAGCEADAPQPPAAVVDEERPCRFAAAGEIAAAVGEDDASAAAVEARPGMDKSRTLLCNYRLGPPFSSVSLYVESGVSEDEFRARMERDPLNTDPLDGFGDVAYTHGGVNVLVWEGGRVAGASLQDFRDPDEARQALEGLAALIESKL